MRIRRTTRSRVWLSLKLAALGYRVWSDVTKLLGGEDFWRDIEPIIRDSTVKVLYVLSRASNHKEDAKCHAGSWSMFAAVARTYAPS